MHENDLIGLLTALRGNAKKSAQLIINCVGDEMTIATCAPGCANTASFTISENTRMARNAMVTVIMQIMLSPYNGQD